MECRQSSLSDYQWCEQNGIHLDTFYNWVGKLRKGGYFILMLGVWFDVYENEQ